MINRAQSILFAFAAISGAWLLGPSAARADLAACGDIFLSGDAECEYRPTKECMTTCMTVAVEESCVAEVYNECETSCTVTASTECETGCTETCVDNCTTTTTTEQPPSCLGLCLADCESDDDRCGNSSHRGACGRCAKHNCAKKCERMCGDDPEPKKVTTVTQCTPTCTTACSASCTAKANTQCQVDCQEKTYVECEEKMVERCDTQCKEKGGAIFCDGQFVNATNADSCADELLAEIKIDIDIEGSIKVIGDTTKDTADDVGDEIDDVCSVVHVGAGRTRGAFGALVPLVALGLWLVNRRRARR